MAATAYAALVSLLNNLDLIQHHPHHSFSFDNKQIESLLESVLFLIHFMETTDYHGGAAEDLERQIACAAHAAEDVIESHVVDQITGGSTLGGKATPSCFLPDLQKAIEDMEFVRREAIKAPKSQSGFKAEQPISSATNLSSQRNTMVGFDKALHQLLDLLTGEANGRRVIPIVGMGGLGKTTLARNALQHKLIMEHFDFCLWATISQQYDVKAILNQLLSCLNESTSGTVSELGVRLHKSLYRRRYLIILDDMWSFEVWDEIKSYFPEDEDNRSRIVVTSRQQGVADHLISSPCFPMDLLVLEEDKSWDLFCEKAFGEEGCPLELESVGYKIVRKCRGLPLAIVVVGGHLRKSPRTQEYWENVANHMDSILSSGEEEESCLDILSLSYSCLPVHLKPCFLYMGTFKEDERVRAATLVKLWIGEGFLKPSKTPSLEEVAEGYLQDLVDRNLIVACKRDLNGKIVSCEIHDIVRELCLKIVEKEEFLRVVDTPGAIDRERRVVIRESTSFEMHECFNGLRSTRSLTCDNWQWPHRGLKFLRVLNGDVARSLKFPNSLKELSLTWSRLQWEELSVMVGSLPLLEALYLTFNAVVGSKWNAVEGEFIRLKSLTVCSCDDLVNFNADCTHFPALRDLVLVELPKLDELASSIGEMVSLRRISLIACSVLLAASAMRMLVVQEEEWGNEDLQLEVSFGFDLQSRMDFQEIMRKEELKSNNLQLQNHYFHRSVEEDLNGCTVM